MFKKEGDVKMVHFCEQCHDTVDVVEKEERKIHQIRDKDVTYIAKMTYCKTCNSVVWDRDFHDFNLSQLEIAYREEENLIQVSEIETLLAKYNIGKRPFSSLLGWGELTVTRYVDGETPTKPYSNWLKLLLNDPPTMDNLLEENKANITEAAYKKCKKAISDRLSFINQTEKTTIQIVADYFLYKCEDITPLALQKLLYYGQSFHRVFFEKFLFEDDCEAWVHGPVFKNIYEQYKFYGYQSIKNASTQDFSDEWLSDSQKDLLDSIVKNFGCYSGKILEEMTHTEVPWQLTRAGLMETESSCKLIPKQLLTKYFMEVKEKYTMLNVEDIRDYSSDMFQKIH